MRGYRRADVLRERLKDTRRWLREHEPLARAEAEHANLLRHIAERPDEIPNPHSLLNRTLKNLYRRSSVGSDMMEFAKDLAAYRLASEDDLRCFRRYMAWATSEPGERRPAELQDFEIERTARERMVLNVRRLRNRLMEELEALSHERRAPSPRLPSTPEGEPDPETRRGTAQAPDEVKRPAVTFGLPPGDVGSSEPATRPPWVGYLGIEGDDNTQIVRRGDREVDFSGRLLHLSLLKELMKSGRQCTLPQHLRSAWKQAGLTPPRSIQTVRTTISELRRMIKGLGIKIVHKKGRGYRLEDAGPNGPAETRSPVS